MVSGDPKTKKEEKAFLIRHLICFGSLDSPIDCQCPVKDECTYAALKNLIDHLKKYRSKR